MDESVAIRESRAGNRQAFGTLVERYYKSVYRLAYHYAGNHQDAGDVCQEAFLIALEKIDRLRDCERFEGWILVIASNLLRRRVRQAIRGRRHLQSGERALRQRTAASPFPGVCDSVGDDERAQAVRIAFQRIPQKMRVPAILVLMEGRSQKNVAQILGCSEATVCRHVEAARSMLRADLHGLID